MERQPPDREDRVVARRGAGGGLGHGLFQAQVKRALAFEALTHDWSLTLLGLEIGVRTRGPKGVVSKPSGDKQEPGQEDRRQGHGMNHPVADARDDFEERTFPCGAGSHSSKRSTD